MAEPGHVEDEAFFELQTAARGNVLAEREEVNESAGAMLQFDSGERVRVKPKARKSVLERLEVGEALDNDGQRQRRWSSALV